MIFILCANFSDKMCDQLSWKTMFCSLTMCQYVKLTITLCPQSSNFILQFFLSVILKGKCLITRSVLDNRRDDKVHGKFLNATLVVLKVVCALSLKSYFNFTFPSTCNFFFLKKCARLSARVGLAQVSHSSSFVSYKKK